MQDAHISTIADGGKAGHGESCVGSYAFCLEMTHITFAYIFFWPYLVTWLHLISVGQASAILPQ